nr:ABC transporter permease [Bacteroidota bacterium]
MMLYHNIKLTLRNFKHNASFSLLNLIGLSIGITVVVLLMAYIQNESTYDSYHKKAKRIYRINVLENDDGKINVFANAPNAVGPTAQEFIPELESQVRILKNNFGDPTFVSTAKDNFIEKNYFWCDASYFKIFDVNILSGNPLDLNKPNKVFLSKSKARQYYGNENCVGKTILVNGSKQIEVAGVYDDLPQNTSMRMDFIASYASTSFSRNPNTWDNASFETYVLLKENVSPQTVDAKWAQMVKTKIPKDEQWFQLKLQALTDIHLHSANAMWNYSSDLNDYATLKHLSLLALLIIIIACVNYMNLSTARLQKRMKEIGISKTLGASFKTLFVRFYTETAILIFVAIVFSFLLSIILLPVFANVISKPLSVQLLFHPYVLLGYAILWLSITALSGLYPAYLLASANVTATLSQRNKLNANHPLLRKILVTAQYAASVILIIAVIVIQQQLNFIRNKNLGFNPQNIVAISTVASKTDEPVNALINELKNLPEVKTICRSQSFPGIQSSGRSIYKNDADENGFPLTTNRASAEILETLKLKLLAGTILPLNKSKDDTLVEVVVNKTAIDYLGLKPNDAIGKKISCQLGNNSYITGVVDNFNFESLHQPVSGYAFHNASREPFSFLLVQYNTKNMQQLLSKIETIFKKTNPQWHLIIHFLISKCKVYIRVNSAVHLLPCHFLYSLFLLQALAFLVLQLILPNSVQKKLVCAKCLVLRLQA